MAEVLQAPHRLEFPYTRSTGPIVGRFMAGLRDQRILGIRGADDRVIVPPQEYDPVTAETLGPDRMLYVGTEGTVTSWSWNPTPRHGQPLDGNFAWALILLDGADTPMLHAVRVPSADDMSTGMRVAVEWADERSGSIHDIACFVPA